MRKTLPAAFAIVALGALGLVVPARAASASAPSADLGLAGFAHMVMDTAHGHVFISEGDKDRVVVSDHKGALLARLMDLPDAEQLAVSPDTSSVYVAVGGLHEVAAIDTTTYQVTSTFDTQGTCPYGLAFAAGMLWFSYDDCSTAYAHLGAIDLDTGAVSLDLASLDNAPEAGLLASVPNHPDWLLADGLSSWEVTGGPAPTATLRGRLDEHFGGSLAVTPDGSEVVVPWPQTDEHVALSTDDFSVIRRYASDAFPNSVAVNGDGRVATGSETPGPTVQVYLPGETEVYATQSFGRDSLRPDGIVYGSTFLFVVTRDGNRASDVLHTVVPKADSGLSIHTDKGVYAYHGKATVTAHLTHHGSDGTVSIYAQEINGPKHLVKRGSVGASGDLMVRVSLSKRTTFSAVYRGDSDTQAGQASRRVQVRASVRNHLYGYYKTVGRFRLYHTSKDPKIVATVTPGKAGKCVFYGGERWIDGGWHDLSESHCFRLNRASQSTVYWVEKHQVGQKFRFRGQWHGDAANTSSVGGWSYLRFTR